jgi:hypothetical protein
MICYSWCRDVAVLRVWGVILADYALETEKWGGSNSSRREGGRRAERVEPRQDAWSRRMGREEGGWKGE